jgi:hypothetical protein
MSPRALVPTAAWLLSGSLLLGAPSRSPAAEPAESVPAAAVGDDPFSGTWDVKGITVDQKSGDTRVIEGHVVLTRKNDHWSASAELKTDFPTQGGPLHTDVIGKGEGRLAAGGLEGKAHTQLVIQTVPGVDTDFAFVPRNVGPRIQSDWKAQIRPDGTLVVELTNSPEKGETYSPTKTTLKGKRVDMPSEK